MKKVVLLLLVLMSITASAQFMNPRMNQRGRGIRQAPMPNQNQKQKFEFNPARNIGITIYDVEQAAKKIKLKKSKKEFVAFKNTLTKFNKDLNDIKRINTFTFAQQKNNVESSYKLANESRDATLLTAAFKQASEAFAPIVKQVEAKEKALDEALQAILSAKQMERWKKYKRKQKTKRP